MQDAKPKGGPPDAPPRFDPATEARIEREAQITDQDIEAARLAWREFARPPAKDLLDAGER
ncbi:MAG TPA: hypothetical protein VFS33_08175 [Gemmatimonadales bacterium]|nr:hypothetical protein [Gemmatimonadales bacterium]